eukprot:scaffold118515_cov28-Tisochrysis_lutea.AAC.3
MLSAAADAREVDAQTGGQLAGRAMLAHALGARPPNGKGTLVPAPPAKAAWIMGGSDGKKTRTRAAATAGVAP